MSKQSSGDSWNPWKLTAIGMALVVATALVTGLVEARKARHWDRGVSFQEKGKHREALIEFRNVVALDPNNAEAQYRLGLAAFRVGDARLAYHALGRAWSWIPIT